MASGTFYTFWDGVQYLADTLGVSVSDGTSLRQCKRAILAAYRDVPSQHNWTYYNRDHRLDIEASYATGTIAYDHTGGAYERMLTLTSGTWPTNAAKGVVQIAGVNYQADAKKSSTRLTLKENSNPGADVASGTSYTWFRDRYTLPTDFREGSTIRNATTIYPMELVSPAEIQRCRNSSETTGTPRKYAMVGDRDLKNRLAVVIYPPSSSDFAMDLSYTASPAPMRTPQYSTGTVTVSGETVTGSSTTAWTSDMAGSVFRIGTASEVPDGREGDNPFVEERIIKSVFDANTLELESGLDNDYTSATKYRISDLVDVSDGALLTYFLQYAEMELSRLKRDQDYQQRFIAIKAKKLDAMSQDHRFTDSPGTEGSIRTSLFGVRTTADY